MTKCKTGYSFGDPQQTVPGTWAGFSNTHVCNILVDPSQNYVFHNHWQFKSHMSKWGTNMGFRSYPKTEMSRIDSSQDLCVCLLGFLGGGGLLSQLHLFLTLTSKWLQQLWGNHNHPLWLVGNLSQWRWRLGARTGSFFLVQQFSKWGLRLWHHCDVTSRLMSFVNMTSLPG